MSHMILNIVLILVLLLLSYSAAEESASCVNRPRLAIGSTTREANVIREVVQPDDEAQEDAWRRLDRRCRTLARLDADLVEWTLPPATGSGKCIVAELLITDPHRPLEQLVMLLRRVADEVQRLTR